MKINLDGFMERLMQRHRERNAALEQIFKEKENFMKFSIGRYELKTLSEWTHDCSLGSDQGAIGGPLTYTFTPNNLGIVTKVICACGEEKDLTDYDEW